MVGRCADCTVPAGSQVPSPAGPIERLCQPAPGPDHASVPTHRGRAASTARLALAAAIALIALSPLAPLTPAAEAKSWRYLPPPSGMYSPRHVWQMKDNCIWAAGSMLLDKWSHGRVRASQFKLRKASGDKEGGSTLRELSRGFAKAARVKLKTPGYGGSMEWWQLLDRLESGGGAVIVGEYNRLPAHFSRWSRGYAARRSSSHAVFVERYDRRHGRVWIDDPLAPGGWPGEWIPVDDLRRFADFENGSVQAAATPARRHPTTAPLIDQAYRLGAPKTADIAIIGTGLGISVPLRITGGFPRPAAQRFVATWRPADGGSSEKPVVTRSKKIAPSRNGFRGVLPLPTEPGHYSVDLKLAPARGHSPARDLGTVEVRVVYPYAAAIAVTAEAQTDLGEPVPLGLTVANIGSVAWLTAPKPEDSQPDLVGSPDGPVDAGPTTDLAATLTLYWRAHDGAAVRAFSLPLGLAPGDSLDQDIWVSPPPDPGVWSLEARIDHPMNGPMSDMEDAITHVAVHFLDPMAGVGR